MTATVAPARRPDPSDAERVLAHERQRAMSVQRSRRRLVLLSRLAIVVGTLVGWTFASGTLIRPLFVSTPLAVAEQLLEWSVSADFWFHVRFTLAAAGLGFLFGALAAVALAWPLALHRTIFRVVEPYFLVAYSVPAVALGPVFILWFGIGLLPKVVLASYFVFFVVFINTVEGIRQGNWSGP